MDGPLGVILRGIDEDRHRGGDVGRSRNGGFVGDGRRFGLYVSISCTDTKRYTYIERLSSPNRSSRPFHRLSRSNSLPPRDGPPALGSASIRSRPSRLRAGGVSR